MNKIESVQIDFEDPKIAQHLFGPQNFIINEIEKLSQAKLASCGASLILQGHAEQLELLQKYFAQLYTLLEKNHALSYQDMLYAYSMLEKEEALDLETLYSMQLSPSQKKRIYPKSLSQRDYIRAMREKTLSFAVGPAGTGKTYLAVAVALEKLFSKQVKRIIITRPAVEAGEKLGFLPGDLVQKVDPFLRPIYDALYDMVDAEQINHMLANNVIEVAPLAFMRGRTLSSAYVILDEAQNTTPSQMKMFVTRLGNNSQMVICGDISQVDLPEHSVQSGLKHILQITKFLEDTPVIKFHAADVIRHPLVAKIVKAYELLEKSYSK